jgi:hypothetical protein
MEDHEHIFQLEVEKPGPGKEDSHPTPKLVASSVEGPTPLKHDDSKQFLEVDGSKGDVEDNEDDQSSSPPPAHENNDDIELSRKALPTLEEEPNVCSICLDEFTEPDPAMSTACFHTYHLQCIMQWAQRSRECPLCFKPLALQDDTLNQLLPFGEYIPPHQEAAQIASLEHWEMERLLIRLSAASQRQERRTARHTRLRREVSGGSVGSSQARDIPSPNQQATSPDGSRSVSTATINNTSSWPPPASSNASAAVHSFAGRQPSSSSSSSSLLSTSSLKSRFASFNFRDSLNKTTKELKSFFGVPSSSRDSSNIIGGGGGGPVGASPRNGPSSSRRRSTDGAL